MTIYTPIPPTYLYIKQHSITGLKYFGKTTRDPYTYNGSGKYWKRHLKKYGKEHVVTLWVSELYQNTSISDYALQFSIENNIVESNEWANLKPENGLDGGGTIGIRLSAEAKANMSKPKSAEHKANISAARTGKKQSAEHNTKISSALTGKPKSAEARANLSIAKKGKSGKPKSAETRAKISAANKDKKQSTLICPHCNTIGGISNMKRWHFNNCKLK